ncbi:MAG TPA: SBBP repeat-containing protein, partial [Acidobacteriota bacterium]|nr:SBBP repeat-containing protein [Acidobacteriota bacterium]
SPDGTVYVVGMTSSSDFPVTVGAYSCTDCGSGDIFLSRFDEDLTTLLASTIIGGNSGEDFPWLAIAQSGEIYITGTTSSADFPITPSTWDPIHSGPNDVFISRFNADLSTLVASTYLGGSGDDGVTGLVIDGSGNILACGSTSGDFPTTIGAYEENFNGGVADFFVSKLSSDLSSLSASTYLGGMYRERYADIAINPSGSVVISGTTHSYDFPSTPGVYDESFNGPHVQDDLYNADCCISILDNELTTLEASTFVGAALFDGSFILALDSAGNVFIGGHTMSPEYPTTPGAFDEDHNGVNEYMLTKLRSDLSDIDASTFLVSGAAGWLFCTDLAVDGEGTLYTTGGVFGSGIQVSAISGDTSYGGGVADGFLQLFDSALATPGYASYFGGSGTDGTFMMALDGSGTVYLAGYTESFDLPTTYGAHDRVRGETGQDAFVVRACVQPDCDEDGILNLADNCPTASNSNQDDTDGDDLGDACDNCPDTYNPDQTDLNYSGIGDICEEGFTPTGYWVQLDPTDSIRILFLEVTEVGVTEMIPSASGPEPPAGYLLVPPTGTCYYDIHTDATYAGSIRIRFLYDPTDISGDESNLRIFHETTAKSSDVLWEDCTYSLDIGSHWIWGEVTSLSNFILAEPDCLCDCHADPQCDGLTDVLDVVHGVNVAFRDGADIPDPNSSCPDVTTDVDCNGLTDVLDVVHLVNVAFRSGDPATEFCDPCAP